MSNPDLMTKLQAHLKALYQRAIDADQQLDALKQQGYGQFSAILDKPMLFSTKADRFQPYVFELAEKVSRLEEEIKTDHLRLTLHGMQEITSLLEQFKTSIQAQSAS